MVNSILRGFLYFIIFLMPIFFKVERAKSVVLDGKLLILKRCAKCDAEFYGEETHLKCEACRNAVAKSNSTAKRKKRA